MQYTNTLIQKPVTTYTHIGNLRVWTFQNLSPMLDAIFLKNINWMLKIK